MSVTTLGIDLAAESRNTAACRVRWASGGAVVEWVRLGSASRPLDNDALAALIKEADATGIDAPFGWPRRFVAAVSQWEASSTWSEPWDDDTRRALRLRATDRWLAERQHRAPLSVSADSISVCAMRAATLLCVAGSQLLSRIDGPTFEVYPAAALREWNVATKGYKKDAAARTHLLTQLASGSWVDFGGFDEELVRTDHALDAFICAVVARAASTGHVVEIPMSLRADAAVEGWIHVPNAPPSELVSPNQE
jgi:predicted nuclease with RNAse H fold